MAGFGERCGIGTGAAARGISGARVGFGAGTVGSLMLVITLSVYSCSGFVATVQHFSFRQPLQAKRETATAVMKSSPARTAVTSNSVLSPELIVLIREIADLDSMKGSRFYIYLSYLSVYKYIRNSYEMKLL